MSISPEGSQKQLTWRLVANQRNAQKILAEGTTWSGVEALMAANPGWDGYSSEIQRSKSGLYVILYVLVDMKLNDADELEVGGWYRFAHPAAQALVERYRR